MKLKTTNIEFNVPTVHSSKSSLYFKTYFRSLIRKLNKKVEDCKDFKSCWILSDRCIHPHPIDLNDFCLFCQVIAEYNYPRHKIFFRSIMGGNTIEIRLENRLV